MGTQASCLLYGTMGRMGRMGRMVMGLWDEETVLWGTMGLWDSTPSPVKPLRTTHHAPSFTDALHAKCLFFAFSQKLI
jgi:hypothetical protein